MHRKIASSFATILGALHVIVFLLWCVSLVVALAFSGIYSTPAWTVLLGHLIFLLVYLLLAGTTSTMIATNQHLERIADTLAGGLIETSKSPVGTGGGSGADDVPPSPRNPLSGRARAGRERLEPTLRAR